MRSPVPWTATLALATVLLAGSSARTALTASAVSGASRCEALSTTR